MTKPLYVIIYESIKNNILQNEYPIGSMLPSEAELEKQFSASKTPVRQALKQLENDNYIYRRQGKGSFVANYRPKEKWIQMTGFKMQYNDDWERITAKTIEINTIQSKDVSGYLQLHEDTKLIHLKRIRYLDGKPIFYMEHYISPIVYKEIFIDDETFTSIQQLLSEKAHLELLVAEETIEAVNADLEVANHLDIPQFTALLKGNRVSYTADDRPINIDIFYTNTTKWKYFSSFRY